MTSRAPPERPDVFTVLSLGRCPSGTADPGYPVCLLPETNGQHFLELTESIPIFAIPELKDLSEKIAKLIKILFSGDLLYFDVDSDILLKEFEDNCIIVSRGHTKVNLYTNDLLIILFDYIYL